MVLSRAEEKVGADLRAATAVKIRGLYVIVGPDATNGRPIADVATAALKGGAKVLQLRDKTGDKGQVLATAKKLKALCDEHQALFIMNDDADLAVLSDAHGLHVGQGDLPVNGARRLLSPKQLVGRSNNTLEEALQSQADGADYIAIGAVFPTQTMGKAQRKAVGVETVRKAKDVLSPPVVAIGGINASNAAEVARAGADCICVVSAVTMAKDPEAAARLLVSAIESAKK
jgi:thiamine-phosphate pyrophosphorylase